MKNFWYFLERDKEDKKIIPEDKEDNIIHTAR